MVSTAFATTKFLEVTKLCMGVSCLAGTAGFILADKEEGLSKSGFVRFTSASVGTFIPFVFKYPVGTDRAVPGADPIVLAERSATGLSLWMPSRLLRVGCVVPLEWKVDAVGGVFGSYFDLCIGGLISGTGFGGIIR
mmetsp:Transcript_125274/g.350787  ORF Transcript_125274/g.350787 Transcript_125274/m.350787 type:complete len:137 (+) Transcript_125274:631-1041(+)